MKLWRICLFVLISSWVFSLLRYYFPIGEQENIYKIYATTGIPFALVLLLFINYLNKKEKNKKIL